MNEPLPTFADIEYQPLRVWNRAVMAHNLREDSGKAAMERYLKLFNKQELTEIYLLTQRVMKEGRDKVLKEIKYNMPLQEDEEYVH
jgi:hypothetical protein